MYLGQENKVVNLLPHSFLEVWSHLIHSLHSLKKYYYILLNDLVDFDSVDVIMSHPG